MKELLDRFFYIPKHAKPTDDNIRRLIFPSIAGIVLCMICLAGATWAWFSAGVQLPAQRMTAAYYEVRVESVVKVEGDVPAPQISEGTYTLEADKKYIITLTAHGTVEKCGGYCLIENGDKTVKYYTPTFLPGNTITVELEPTQGGNYTFTGVWGSVPRGEGYIEVKPAASDMPLVNNTPAAEPDKGAETTGSDVTDVPDATDVPDVTGVPDVTDAADEPQDVTVPEEIVYTVQKGDTLSEIAHKYGLRTNELAEYNNIENPNIILAGQKIKIPANK